MQHSASANARLELGPPRLFGIGALLVVSVYGLLAMLPVFISIFVISLMRFGPWTFVLPLAAITFATLLLPFGFGNPFIRRLVLSQQPASGAPTEGFIVQLTLKPRLRTGPRALLEDADDVGWLAFTATELQFRGDSIQLSVPYGQITELHSHNIGWRGLFLYGRPSAFVVSGLPQVQAFHVAERSSSFLPGSRRMARKLFERLVQCQKSS